MTWNDERLSLARTMANEAAMALENARLYEDARNLADRDPLTGFYNHRFLHERLGEEVVRSQRARRPMSVLMLDLDDFKLVNDTFGHLFGDRVLAWTRRADPLDAAGIRCRRLATAATSSPSSCPRPMPTRREPRAERILAGVPRQRRSSASNADPSRSARRSVSATFPTDGRTGRPS